MPAVQAHAFLDKIDDLKDKVVEKVTGAGDAAGDAAKNVADKVTGEGGDEEPKKDEAPNKGKRRSCCCEHNHLSKIKILT